MEKNMLPQEEVQAIVRAARTERRMMIGSPLLPEESCPPSADWLVACYGARDSSGNFDWLSSYLPYADANGTVLEAFDDILPSCPVPVLAGVCAADPFRAHDQLLESIRNKGFKGVCNLPSVALMDGSLRTIVEEQGLGFEREAHLMTVARSKGLYTLALVFSPQEADAMLAAGADALLLHPGLAFDESPTLPIDAYLGKITSLSNRLSPDYPLFACSMDPRHLEGLAYSLLNISGFYAIRSFCNSFHKSPSGDL